jgi:PIN domain nuclease of toxin-antitoxin system
MKAVADTHALVWAITGSWRKLGRRARRIFEAADVRRGTVYVPIVVLVELSELARAGRVALPMPFDRWVEELSKSGSYILLDLTADVVARAHGLFEIPERGDRLIAATAAAHGLPLMTRDETIATCADVECIW